MPWIDVKDEEEEAVEVEVRNCCICGDPAQTNGDEALCSEHASWKKCGSCGSWVESTNSDCLCSDCDGDTVSCDRCGDRIPADDAYTSRYGDYYCSGCFYPPCDDCGNDNTSRDDLEDGLCEKCAEKKASACPNCKNKGSLWLHGTAHVEHVVKSFDPCDEGRVWLKVEHDSRNDPSGELPENTQVKCLNCGKIWAIDPNDVNYE